MHVRASETGGTHLAHWPPPLREHEARPVLVKHQPAGRARHPRQTARLASDARDLLGIRRRRVARVAQAFGVFAFIFISRNRAAPPSRLVCWPRSTAMASSGTSFVITDPEPI
jgi:hypothetical protein